MTDTALSLCNVSKAFGQMQIIRGVNLDIRLTPLCSSVISTAPRIGPPKALAPPI